MPFLAFAHPLPAFAFLSLFIYFKAIPNLSLLEAFKLARLNKKGGMLVLSLGN
jgi:hypothetical protein